ncbi:MAG: alpha/beta fold hydrolase [Pseudomonadota bacterium]
MNEVIRWATRLLCMLLVILGALVGCAGASKIEQSPWLQKSELYKTQDFTASLVTYSNDGIRLHALIATPLTPSPANGYPTIVANHGFVPVPARYGIGHDGEDRRPGDYYRAIPKQYTQHGFRVVMPDYRGHNASGGGQTLTDDIWTNIGLYADDVIALVDDVLPALSDSDPARWYLWSHSMGGPVALQVLVERPVFKSATFWSPMSLTRWETQLDTVSAAVMIHHARGDATTPLVNATTFDAALQRAHIARILFEYSGSEHLLTGDDQAQAVLRDVATFRRGISTPDRDAKEMQK